MKDTKKRNCGQQKKRINFSNFRTGYKLISIHISRKFVMYFSSVSDELDDSRRLDWVVEEEVLVWSVAVRDGLDDLLGQDSANNRRN
jgi:hypothetical protein